MIAVDGFARGQPAVSDSSAALRPAAPEDASSGTKTAAAFDDVLSGLSRRDDPKADSSSQERVDAVASPSIRGAFSVDLAAAINGKAARPSSAPLAEESNARIAADATSATGPEPSALAGGAGAQTPVPAGPVAPHAAAQAQQPAPSEPIVAPAAPPREEPGAAASPGKAGAASPQMQSPAEIEASAIEAREAISTSAAADAALQPRPAGPDADLTTSLKTGALGREPARLHPQQRMRSGRDVDDGGSDPGLPQPAPSLSAAGAAVALASAPAALAPQIAASAPPAAAPDSGLALTPTPPRLFAGADADRAPAPSSPAAAPGGARLTVAPEAAPRPAQQGEVKVAVIERQTHFPPLAPPGPVDQIASRILTEAKAATSSAAQDGETGASSGAPAAASARPQAAPSATRVLLLQLEPEGLGAVSIRMRLSGGRLDLQLEATRADTMRRLGDEKELLVEKLRSAGYAMDHVAVRSAEPQGQQASGANAGQGPSNRGEPQLLSPGMSQQGGSGANEGTGAQRTPTPPRTPAIGDAEERSFDRDRGGAVYL